MSTARVHKRRHGAILNFFEKFTSRCGVTNDTERRFLYFCVQSFYGIWLRARAKREKLQNPVMWIFYTILMDFKHFCDFIMQEKLVVCMNF